MPKTKTYQKISHRRKRLAKGLPATTRKFAYTVLVEGHQTDTKSLERRPSSPKSKKRKLF